MIDSVLMSSKFYNPESGERLQNSIYRFELMLSKKTSYISAACSDVTSAYICRGTIARCESHHVMAAEQGSLVGLLRTNLPLHYV